MSCSSRFTKAWKHFELCESESKGLLEKYSALTRENPGREERNDIGRDKQRFPLLGAYDLCLKCSHLFNILDARGAISVTERVGVIARVRALAVGIAKAWVDQQRGESPAVEEGDPAAKKKPQKRAEVVPTNA